MGIEMQISMNDPAHSFGVMDTDVTTCSLKTVFPGISASLKLL